MGEGKLIGGRGASESDMVAFPHIGTSRDFSHARFSAASFRLSVGALALTAGRPGGPPAIADGDALADAIAGFRKA